MTKIEIINDIANFYNLGNRSIYGSGCVYTDENCNHCGVGRYLKPEYQNSKFIYNKSDINTEIITKYLRDDVPNNELDYEFWSDIQRLHDIKSNWTNEGLSNLGQFKVNELLLRYKNQ